MAKIELRSVLVNREDRKSKLFYFIPTIAIMRTTGEDVFSCCRYVTLHFIWLKWDLCIYLKDERERKKDPYGEEILKMRL